MHSELKPCPFCGGEAEILTAESMHGGYLFGIMCNDCGSRGDVFDTEAEAIATWNTRAGRTCQLIPTRGKKYRPHVPTLTCSNCGAVYELSEANPSETLYGFAFCHNCGAKVVE